MLLGNLQFGCELHTINFARREAVCARWFTIADSLDIEQTSCMRLAFHVVRGFDVRATTKMSLGPADPGFSFALHVNIRRRPKIRICLPQPRREKYMDKSAVCLSSYGTTPFSPSRAAHAARASRPAAV